jgi:hypothetical protein
MLEVEKSRITSLKVEMPVTHAMKEEEAPTLTLTEEEEDPTLTLIEEEEEVKEWTDSWSE